MEMSEALREPAAGILVLTRDNIDSTWLHFEAGAISTALSRGSGFVCTYLVDIENAAVGLPLGMFQSTVAAKDDTLRLLRTLNAINPQLLPDDRLTKLFGSFWPELESTISQAQTESLPGKAVRDQSEVLDEILETVRGIARGQAASQTEDFGDIIRRQAATPGTATHELFQRLEAAGQLLAKERRRDGEIYGEGDTDPSSQRRRPK